jgi:hypothetical protein
MTGKGKSVGPDCIPGEILKMGGEVMIPYLARLLDIMINNGTIPRDWKKSHSGSYLQRRRSFGSKKKNYRPVSLTSMVCKQMEHTIAGYIRQMWADSDWLYQGQHGFRAGYSCESQIITVCQEHKTPWMKESGWTQS